jgi:hypothetical protein
MHVSLAALYLWYDSIYFSSIFHFAKFLYQIPLLYIFPRHHHKVSPAVLHSHNSFKISKYSCYLSFYIYLAVNKMIIIHMRWDAYYFHYCLFHKMHAYFFIGPDSLRVFHIARLHFTDLIIMLSFEFHSFFQNVLPRFLFAIDIFIWWVTSFV